LSIGEDISTDDNRLSIDHRRDQEPEWDWEQWNLEIREVTLEDAGVYVCQQGHGANSTIKPVLLIVQGMWLIFHQKDHEHSRLDLEIVEVVKKTTY
jgi:hypothetical protein